MRINTSIKCMLVYCQITDNSIFWDENMLRSSTRTTCSKLIRQPMYVMVALEGHTRPKYWRQISWKISRLSPKWRNFTSNFMSATSPVRETWRQMLCLRLHPMAQKGHQRLKYWCQISWKNIHDLSPSISCLRFFTGREIWRQISCLRLSLGHKICLEYFSSKLGCLSFNTFH